MGDGVVYRTGLENLAGNAQETAETQEFCGSRPAPDALFTGRSAGCDGAKVGTDEDDEDEDAYGRTGVRVECWVCHGSGIDYDTCLTCGGFGWFNESPAQEKTK